MTESVRIYDATILRWVDGDTVYMTVDLGFRVTMEVDFRLYGINTPERGQPGYKEATLFNITNAPSGTPVTAVVYKDPEKYGRWLVDITVVGQTKTLNQMLLDANLAVPYFGGKK